MNSETAVRNITQAASMFLDTSISLPSFNELVRLDLRDMSQTDIEHIVIDLAITLISYKRIVLNSENKEA